MIFELCVVLKFPDSWRMIAEYSPNKRLKFDKLSHTRKFFYNNRVSSILQAKYTVKMTELTHSRLEPAKPRRKYNISKNKSLDTE